MPMMLYATPTHGSTKPLPKNKHAGNEAIQRTLGSATTSDKQGTGVRKLHDELIKPRPNGTLALLHSDRQAMMPRRHDMH
jgi:hypothetical protein